MGKISHKFINKSIIKNINMEIKRGSKAQTRLMLGIIILLFGTLGILFWGLGIIYNNINASWIGKVILGAITLIVLIIERFLR